MAASIDPIKILQKYKYVLIASIFVGVVVGYGAQIFFGKFFPGYSSTALFLCSPVETEIQTMAAATIDEDEMARFMGTQVQTLKGERVISAVLADARLEALAPDWYKRYTNKGNLDVVNAYEDLEKLVRASAIPNTYLIQLSVQVRKPNDAAGLVTLITDNYIRLLQSSTGTNVTKRKEAIRQAIVDADATLSELNRRKDSLLQEGNMNSIDSAQSAQAEMLRIVSAQIINNQQQIEAYQVILDKDEAQLKRNTPIEYDSTLRNVVEQMPQILNLKQQIIALQAQQLSLQTSGFLPEHRTYKLVINQLDANVRKLADTREELLADAFEARIAGTRMAINQLKAQVADLTTKKEDLDTKLTELMQTSEEIDEIKRQTENTLAMKATHETDLASLNQTAGLDSSNRIEVTKPANVPDRPSFPKIIVMIPAGVFLIVGLTAGVIVVFEMLDQRVKSAADIAMIPRTRVLGIIPDAAEDPVAHTSIETVFMDSPNSVLTEHFRQLRTKITKNMTNHGHKTLLVAGAMPGSGATSVASNLAQACTAAGKKTLLIDTNFRRASIHTAFGLSESPGLSEALAGEMLAECVQETTENGPDILAAGVRNLRIVERLGSEQMGKVLAEASTNYDIVILDVAPAIVAGDAVILASQVDATMLVVRALNEKRGQVARLKNELSDNRGEFLGVLVNGVRSNAGGYMRKNIRTSSQYHAGDTAQTA